MSVSRDDFSIAFRSALLQRGATQKFSIFSLIVVAIVVFFLDVYGFTAVKTARSFINDVVYRVTYLASAPTRLFPGINQGIASHFNLKKLTDLPNVEELASAGFIDTGNIDKTIFGTGKFYKEHEEEKKEMTKTNKSDIQNLLERKGCVSGSSAKIIETESTDYRVYEVTCVKKSKRFIVKCDENACSE